MIGRHSRWLPLLCGVWLVGAASGDAPGLEWVSQGAAHLVGGVIATARHELTAARPAALKALPYGLCEPRYTTLEAGPPEARKVYTFCVDQPAGQPMRLWVDATGAGQLSAVEFKEVDGGWQNGHCLLTVHVAGEDRSCGVVISASTPKNPQHSILKDCLHIYSDYAWRGQLQLGDKAYYAVIIDPSLSFVFAAPPPEAPLNLQLDEVKPEGGPGPSFATIRQTGPIHAFGGPRGPVLLIDIRGEGHFGRRGERFRLGEPFNIAGTTWMVTSVGAGGVVQVEKSAEPVAEIPLAPNLSVGQIAPSFKATTLNGKAVDFPADFGGGVVMLDFWATWLDPRLNELPNVVQTYAKYHGRGFDILGISLDKENMADTLRHAFLPAHDMTWEQVYDGKGWKAAVADMYALESAPKRLIVDGDNGKILAADVRGAALPKAVEVALKSKGL
jgi:hypothetical protein